MDTKSVPTRGSTLNYAAVVYDLFEPILLLANRRGMITDQLDAEAGGAFVSIDVTAEMI